MPPTLAGLEELRLPIRQPIPVYLPRDDEPPTSKVENAVYLRAEFTTYDKVFSVWMAKGLTYAEVMQRLLNSYTNKAA